MLNEKCMCWCLSIMNRTVYFSRYTSRPVLNNTGCFWNWRPYFMCVLYGPQQREKILTQMCPKTIGVLTVAIWEINRHENSSHSIHQYQWSWNDGVLLSLSNSYIAHANISQQFLGSVRLMLLNMALAFSYSDIYKGQTAKTKSPRARVVWSLSFFFFGL